jgi:hypothetical protein
MVCQADRRTTHPYISKINAAVGRQRFENDGGVLSQPFGAYRLRDGTGSLSIAGFGANERLLEM